MVSSKISEGATVCELSDLEAVRTWYRMDGPHATAVVPGFPATDRRGDVHARWPAVRADLRHLGASDAALGHLDDLFAGIEVRGFDLLVTANDDGSAYCWLTRGAPEMQRVGPVPTLVRAIAELSGESVAVGAVVDRIGADLFSLDRLERHALGEVVGEVEHVHRGLAGGWSQPRYQRHSELTWERNAELVAAELRRAATAHAALVVVITGDQRAAGFVSDHLAKFHDLDVEVVAAGGRHEPGTPERLHDAARVALRRRGNTGVAAALERLREELGQQDLAIAGEVGVLEAIASDRVGTLLVDVEATEHLEDADAVAKAALASGADVVAGTGFGLTDGLGALLRYPYR